MWMVAEKSSDLRTDCGFRTRARTPSELLVNLYVVRKVCEHWGPWEIQRESRTCF